MPHVTFPKGRTRKQEKSAADRAEAKVKKRVRAQVETRDGRCRLAHHSYIVRTFGPCDGPSQWFHIGEYRRARTRKMPPEVRHQTAHSGIACQVHHAAYDAEKFEIVYDDPELGMDGPITVKPKEPKR